MTARVATPPVMTAELVVNIADLAVAGGECVLSTAGLGSCVAVILHDPVGGVAGLAHVLLPDSTAGTPGARPAKYADTAVPLLAVEMQRHGARGPLVAKLVGGARMFAALLSSGVNMGLRNLEATRSALERLGIPVVADDVGGEYGRSLRVEARTGRVQVRSLSGRDRDL